jgi:hypothetical protein
MSISESAVLAKLSIGTWSAEKKSRKLTEELIAAKGGRRSDAAKVITNLMSGTRAAKDISDYAAGCRLEHTTTTLPWEDRGFRLLPTSLVLDYKTDFNFRRDKFWLMTTEFKKNYHRNVALAEQALGDMFEASDYPSLEVVMSKYHFDLTFSPVPEAGHFMLDIPKQDLEEMKESVDNLVAQRTGGAMREAWERLHKMLLGMSEKLSKEDEKTRWHDSFVDNPMELCELLSHLNVTNDPMLEKAREELEKAIGKTSIEMIKESPVERVRVRDKVDAILEQFDW